MDEKTKNGYVAAIICVFICLIFLVFSINNEFNMTGQIFWGVTIIFGLLAVGSVLKPDSVGTAVLKILENFANDEKESKSVNKQVQQKSSGVQVMAHGSSVNINVPSEKKQKYQEEEKDFLKKETIIVRPSKEYSYEFDFLEGDILRGEIASSSCINVYFVDDDNFDKRERGRSYEYDDCNEDILESNIEYHVPSDGTWHLIIENEGKKTAKVKIHLYVS